VGIISVGVGWKILTCRCSHPLSSSLGRFFNAVKFFFKKKKIKEFTGKIIENFI
jgi:hypothetical protein